MIDELTHEGEDLGIVCGGSQDQLVIAEGIFHTLCPVVSGQIADGNVGHAAGFQFRRQHLSRFLGVAVDGGVADADAVGLCQVAGPCVIQSDVVLQILFQHRSVQRADLVNLQGGSLLQDRLHLSAVLADDAEIVTPRFAGPVVIFRVQGAELAETVSGEQDLVRGVVGHHNLRPVDHGREHEVQLVLAQIQHIAVLHFQALSDLDVGEELGDHVKGLAVAHHHCLRVFLHKCLDGGGVVRLHVLHDQIIRRHIAQRQLDVLQPFFCLGLIDGIHDSDLVVDDRVGIVGHTFRHDILPFEQIDIVIVGPDVNDRICDFLVHIFLLCSIDGASSSAAEAAHLRKVHSTIPTGNVI